MSKMQYIRRKIIPMGVYVPLPVGHRVIDVQWDGEASGQIALTYLAYCEDTVDWCFTIYDLNRQDGISMDQCYIGSIGRVAVFASIRRAYHAVQKPEQ
jgi:hypothetical protein